MADVIESLTIIAAYPGFALVSYYEIIDKLDDSHFDYQEIIGWEVYQSEGPFVMRARRCGAGKLHQPSTWAHIRVTPITLYGAPFEGDRWCIKTPAGKFEFPGDRTFDNETAALTYLSRGPVEEIAL